MTIASIVTIMKGLKTSTFDNLKDQLAKFPRMKNVDYTVPMVRESIDKLITDNFLERDEKDRNTFTYLPG